MYTEESLLVLQQDLVSVLVQSTGIAVSRSEVGESVSLRVYTLEFSVGSTTRFSLFDSTE